MLTINSSINASDFSEALKENGRVRIPNFLDDASAERVRETLINDTEWGLVYSNAQGEPVVLSALDLKTLKPKEMQAITTELYKQGSSMYSYIYYVYPIIDAIQQGVLKNDSVLSHVANFLNGTAFIKFARELTGTDTLVKFDPQATCYGRGHFLNLHDDMGDGRDYKGTSVRRYAVVLGFTKNWSVNWGGQTNFFDKAATSSCESWYPAFNTLSIFEVPTLHSVGHVNPMANDRRYAITGWLRDDPEVQRPDLDV